MFRDFVSVRRWSLIEGIYYCASVSTLHESRPPQRDKVRLAFLRSLLSSLIFMQTYLIACK